MRRRTALWAATATTCILTIGWQIGASGTTATATAATADTGNGRGNRSAAIFADSDDGPGRGGRDRRGPRRAAVPAVVPRTAAAATDGIHTGPPVPYPRGSVSVTVTVEEGAITDVDALIRAENPVSRNINQRVEELLGEEVMAEQNSDITMISGSTYTSQAYARSLQAALDGATP